jgi:hypothetical protein
LNKLLNESKEFNMQPLIKPWEQLQKAIKNIEGMELANSLDEYEESWTDFLHNLERAWNKATNHLSKSPKFQGWNRRGQVESLRRTDSLLAYLINARGAEEHSIEDITTREAGGFGINPAFGNTLHLKSIKTDGTGNVSIESDQPYKITFFSSSIKLLPVINRGRKYEVPASHLGKLLSTNKPIELAKIAVEFYQGYFKEAESHFVK